MKAAHSFVFVRLGLLRWAAVIIINFHSLISDNHALTRLCLIKTKMIMIWVIAISRLVRSPIPDSSSHYIGPQKWTALLIDAQSQLISSFITAISFGWNTNTRQPCSPFGRLFKYKHGPRRTQSSTKASLWLVLFFFQKFILSDQVWPPKVIHPISAHSGPQGARAHEFPFFFPARPPNRKCMANRFKNEI